MLKPVRVDIDEEGNREVSSPKPRKLKPLENDDQGNPQCGSPPLIKKPPLRSSKGGDERKRSKETAAKPELTPVVPPGRPPAGNPGRSALKKKPAAQPVVEQPADQQPAPEPAPRTAVMPAIRPALKKPVEPQEEPAATPSSSSTAPPPKKSALKKSVGEATRLQEPSCGMAPPKSALKSALKNSRGNAAQPQGPVEPPPATIGPKRSCLKQRGEAAPPPQESNEPPRATAGPKKSCLKQRGETAPLREPKHPAPPIPVPLRSCLKQRGEPAQAKEEPFAEPPAPELAVPAQGTRRASLLSVETTPDVAARRPSACKMTLDIVDSSLWSAKSLCKHYYYYAGQKKLWQEAMEANANKRQRISLVLEDSASDTPRRRSSGSSPRSSMKRSMSLVIQDSKPTNTAEFEIVSEKEQVFEISPLKEIFLAKKPDQNALRELLKDLPDKDKWINCALDSTPPPMPAPLFQAVAAGLSGLVEVLVEFKVDVEAQYPGKSMLKGWIKPMTPLVDCVRSRQARFVGTMLGDKLLAIEQLLVSAADAKKIAAGEIPTNEAQLAEPYVDQEADVDDDSDYSEPADDIDEESMRVSEAPAGWYRLVSEEAMSRKSVQLKGYGERRIWHTQGHPDVRYTLSMEFCGTGASCVREAVDIASGTGYAIKAGCKTADMTTLGKDPEAELWHEINTMRKLSHPNIIKLVETFEDDAHIFMVLELCSGGELFEKLISIGFFPESTALRLAYQMGAAIRHLHELGICHRDIQLENFILKKDVPIKDAIVKLVDFSTSKEIVDKLYTKVCTLHYVAPEILTSKTGYNEKVDVWSFGILMYILLCGSPPFYGDSELDVLQAIKAGHYSFAPDTCWSQVSEETKDAITKSLVLDPDTRIDIYGLMENPQFVKAEIEVAYSGGSPRKENAATAIIRSAFQLMAETFSNEQMEELRDLFRKHDQNKNGMVELSAEILEGLECMVAASMDPTAVMPLIRSRSFAGNVNYTLSLATMFDKRRHMKRQAAHCVFDIFDVDSNDRVSLYEISQALAKTGEDSILKKVNLQGTSMNEVQQIWEEMGTVFSEVEIRDHEMCFEEFFRQLPRANKEILF